MMWVLGSRFMAGEVQEEERGGEGNGTVNNGQHQDRLAGSMPQHEWRAGTRESCDA